MKRKIDTKIKFRDVTIIPSIISPEGFRVYFDYDGIDFKRYKRLLIEKYGDKVEDEVWKFRHQDELYFIDMTPRAFKYICGGKKKAEDILVQFGYSKMYIKL